VCPPRTELGDFSVPAKKILCALAHDHVLLRQGLRRLLEDETDIEVVSEAGNASECLRKLYEFLPDVLVADATMFGLPLSEAQFRIQRESPRTRLVFLGKDDEETSAMNFPGSMAGACAARRTSAEELVNMVRGSAKSPAAALKFSVEPETRPQPTPFPEKRILTARERDVLKLLVEGKTVRAAAGILGLSSKTVDAHKFNLMRKLGLHNKAELVMWAIQKRVVKIPVNF